jgi:glyoxylase-like metal-dependent hydrolase (beta-lactamase superfamily II)
MISYEVLAARYGSRHTRRTEVFLGYDHYGEPDGPLDMDYYFWVVRGPETAIVVDTGYAPAVGERRGRTLLAEPARLFAELGLTGPNAGPPPLVIATHFHYDHIGNLDAFGSSRIVAGRDEADFWFGPLADRLQLAHPTEPTELAQVRERRSDLVLVDDVAEVAPGVRVHQVGGHTPGQLVVSVEVGGRTVVLAADAAHYLEEIERDRPFGVVADLPAMYQGFETIRRLAGPDGVIVPGHDPAVAQSCPRYSPDISDLVVRIA